MNGAQFYCNHKKRHHRHDHLGKPKLIIGHTLTQRTTIIHQPLWIVMNKLPTTRNTYPTLKKCDSWLITTIIEQLVRPVKARCCNFFCPSSTFTSKGNWHQWNSSIWFSDPVQPRSPMTTWWLSCCCQKMWWYPVLRYQVIHHQTWRVTNGHIKWHVDMTIMGFMLCRESQ